MYDSFGVPVDMYQKMLNDVFNSFGMPVDMNHKNIE